MTQTPLAIPKTEPKLTPWQINLASLLVFLGLFLVSLSIGVANFSWSGLVTGELADSGLFITSRLPRTLAVVLTGTSLSIAGMLIQIVLRNRFVEPSMVGATQASTLGILVMSLVFPSSSLMLKMSVATMMALFGMMVFMGLIRKFPPHDFLMIPLVGIVFGGIIDAISLFIAYQQNAMQMMSVWLFGDFSAVLAGRYEWLWLTGILSLVAYVLADKLTIVGLGDNIAINLGVNSKYITRLAIAMVAMISAVVVVTVGMIPFVGLVVPNIVSRMMGDQLRHSLPTVALLGACSVLICDIIARTIRYPYEIPVAIVFGVLGAGIFLWLLLKKG